MTEALHDDDPFAEIEERHAADYVLRNTQQHLVSLSSQADLKASVVMTVAALLIGAAAARAEHDDMLWGIVPFVVILSVSLLWAVFAIVPRKVRPRGRADLLFFTDVASMSLREYEERMAQLLFDDRRLYRAMVDNIHDHSVFLVQQKYRYLRHSYQWFMCSFFAGASGIVVKQVLG